MNNSWNHLAACRTKLLALKKIAKDADSASGVSFAVRRGVARDNEENENDSERRPWVTVEVSNEDFFQGAIAILIASLQEQVTFWEMAVKRDMAEAENVLNNK